MKHERGIVGLWGAKIPLYWSSMTKPLYNLRLLADRPMTGGAFDAFMDGYGAALDVYPVCRQQRKLRSAERLWADFVRISEDANSALRKADELLLSGLNSRSEDAPPKELSRLRNASA